MGLRDFKVPKMKFKKIKMNLDAVHELEEIDYEKLMKKNLKAKRDTPYEDMTHYKTVKEFFMQSVQKYTNEPCILEKPSHKEPYQVKTYKEFGEDVLSLGTALIKDLKLKDKKVIIVGETRIWLVCIIYGYVMWSTELLSQQIESYLRMS